MLTDSSGNFVKITFTGNYRKYNLILVSRGKIVKWRIDSFTINTVILVSVITGKYIKYIHYQIHTVNTQITGKSW